MQTTSKPTLWAMLASLALVLVLTACGGTATTTTPAAPTQTVAVATSAAAAPTVPAPNATSGAPATAATNAAPANAPATDALPPVGATKLNLNEVTEDQLLQTIPSFGNRMVREFFEYRPYVSIQQFRREIGKYVSPEQVALYEQYVFVPISVNEADAATLQQIPGIDAASAEQLIAARPYGSNQAFLSKLAEIAPRADQAVAQSYLSQ